MSKSAYSKLADDEPHYQDHTVQRPGIFNFLALQERNLNTKWFLNQLLVHVVLSLKDDAGKPLALVMT